ncbi:MAG: 2-C-methyl-D-erythritol 4-phosphate cytidylyltransferase [Parvibaculaceae bacterium]
MLKGKPVTAIIPVRGGSKGIPRKNLRRIGKDTLLERAIKLGKTSPRIERVIVSTDDPEMQAIAELHDVAAPSLRPAHLASDGATTVAVVTHLIEECAIDAGYLLLLQATAPLRTRHDLDALLNAFEAAEADAIVSLAVHDEPRPEKLKRIIAGRVSPYLGQSYEGPRQGLPQPFALNGAFYLVDRDVFLREKTFLPSSTIGYVMPAERSHNLDTLTDWQTLEAMIAHGFWQIEEFD